MRALLALAATGTAFIAAWLSFVLLVVRPAGTRASVPAWIAIDLVAIALVVASLAWLARPAAIVVLVACLSGIAAAVVGTWMAATWILTPPGQDAEGYVLLIGGWLAMHGIVQLLAAGVPGLVRGPGSRAPG
jgi:hypothetical protein